jgi:hypothetical protein
VFRGDTRPPSRIYDVGFQPKGTTTDLYQHVGYIEPSGFVSTSKRATAPRDFAGKKGWVY